MIPALLAAAALSCEPAPSPRLGPAVGVAAFRALDPALTRHLVREGTTPEEWDEVRAGADIEPEVLSRLRAAGFSAEPAGAGVVRVGAPGPPWERWSWLSGARVLHEAPRYVDTCVYLLPSVRLDSVLE